MIDGFSTETLWHAVVVLYAFSFDDLIEIKQEGSRFEYHLDVPSLDATEIIREYKEGRLQISDCNALVNMYARVSGVLKQMRRENKTSWKSRAYEKAWIAGEWSSGRKIK